MNKRYIIGITGKKNHGKDTIANIIKEKYNFKIIHFADPLKKGCSHIFGLTYDQLYGNKKDIIDEYWKITPRKILQFVGTNLLRNQLSNIIPQIEDSIWIKHLEKILIDNPYTNFIIPDIRFQNEVNMLKKHHSIIFKVIRPNLLNEDDHISEKGIDKINEFDKLILNDSTIDDLYNKVNYITSIYLN